MAKATSKPAPAPASAQPATQRYAALAPYAYTVRGEHKTAWTDVGVAWKTKDGKGMSMTIKPGLSVSGRIVLRPIEPKPDAHGADQHAEQFVYNDQLLAEELI